MERTGGATRGGGGGRAPTLTCGVDEKKTRQRKSEGARAGGGCSLPHSLTPSPLPPSTSSSPTPPSVGCGKQQKGQLSVWVWFHFSPKQSSLPGPHIFSASPPPKTKKSNPSPSLSPPRAHRRGGPPISALAFTRFHAHGCPPRHTLARPSRSLLTSFHVHRCPSIHLLPRPLRPFNTIAFTLIDVFPYTRFR